MKPIHLEVIFKALNAANARYLVVGGVAVMAHGYVRMTRDLDLVIALDGDNPTLVLTVFQKLGYRPTVPVQLMDFTNSENRHVWKMEKGMLVFQIISDRYVDCPVDIFVEEPISFSEMYSARVEYEISPQLNIPIIGLTHLRRLKRDAGRPRDLLDLEELDQLNDQI